MKTKLVLLKALLFVLFVPFTHACNYSNVKGSGKIIIENRDVKNFKGIENHSSVEVMIRQGSNYEVKIEADDNIVSHITTEVEDGKLIIGCEKGFRTKSVKAYITLPELEYISVNGSGDIKGENSFKGTDLELVIKGSGGISVKFNGRDITNSIKGSGSIKVDGEFMNAVSKINGSGGIEASGRAEKVDVLVQGSGSFSGLDLNCKEAKVTIQGSGSCDLNVSYKLNVKIMGSGSVSYKGDPMVNVDRQGSGNVVKK